MKSSVISNSAAVDLGLIWVNFAANIILCAAFAAFLIFIFGRENSIIYKLKGVSTIFLKVGLSMCSTAALLNIITMSNPTWTEILLNVGLAILFTWSAWFHYVRFVVPWKKKEAAKKLLRTKIKLAIKK